MSQVNRGKPSLFFGSLLIDIGVTEKNLKIAGSIDARSEAGNAEFPNGAHVKYTGDGISVVSPFGIPREVPASPRSNLAAFVGNSPGCRFLPFKSPILTTPCPQLKSNVVDAATYKKGTISLAEVRSRCSHTDCMVAD